MIRHPYNFVPFAKSVEKGKWPAAGPGGHERYNPDLHSGRLCCILKTEGLLCLKKHFEDLKKRTAAPYIPGSSLKGLIRNATEMLGAGCAKYFPHKSQDSGPTLPGLEACSKEAACLACRVFGYAVEGAEFGWAGKVRFYDSEPLKRWRAEDWREIPPGSARLLSHGPRHRAFYYPNGKPAGWKVYLHAIKPTGAHSDFVSTACVGPEELFSFPIEYENLTTEEFAVLTFALTLRHQCDEHKSNIQLWHKFGYGKGLGLGSCLIEIKEVEPLNVERYFNGSAPERRVSLCSIEKYLETPGFLAMQTYLDFNARAELLYPGEDWFDVEKYKRGSIDDYERYQNEPATPEPIVEPPPPPPPPTPQITIPKRVRVQITKVEAGGMKGITVDEFGGHRYMCVANSKPPLAKKDGFCMIEVNPKSIDHIKHTLQGKVK